MGSRSRICTPDYKGQNPWLTVYKVFHSTGGPHYMREIGDSKNMLAYNEFEYKKTKDYCKLEDTFQKKGHFSIAYTRIKRPHITRARPPVF